MTLKMVFVPPQSDAVKSWLPRLLDSVPDVSFVAPESMDEARREIADADAAFGTIPPDVLAEAGKLRWLQAPAAAPPAGYYYPELISHAVTVTNFREIYNDHISIHIMAVLLAFTKRLPDYYRQQANRNWNPLNESRDHALFLPETTALIVGVGGIGGETARLCDAFGMRVIGVDARREDVPDGVAELHRPDQLDRLLPEADFVIATIPHTPHTEGLFDAEKFSLMKSSAYFINIGRGMTTKLDDLNHALRSGQIGGAALDVYEIEPLQADHPLWNAPNTILTPHVAAYGPHLEERRYEIVAENVRRMINGEPLRNVVDKENWF